MSSLMELLGQHLGDDNIRQISQNVGASEDQTRNAIGAALPALIGVLSRNAQGDGAERMHKAVERDHDGSLLEQLGGLIGGGPAPQTSRDRQFSGEAILGHILGGNRERVERNVSRSSGLDTGSTAKLLGILAPILMGAVGKKQREGGLSSGGLSDLLKKENADIEQQGGGGFLERMMDQDGDGDFDMGDMMKVGMKFLSRRK